MLNAAFIPLVGTAGVDNSLWSSVALSGRGSVLLIAQNPAVDKRMAAIKYKMLPTKSLNAEDARAAGTSDRSKQKR